MKHPATDFGQEAPSLARTASRIDVPPEYRDAVEAAAALLERYHAGLAADGDAPGQLTELAENLRSEWRAVWIEAFESLRELAENGKHAIAAKQYTESRLTAHLIEAPLWRQAYTKPLGYSGDYQVMNYIYAGSPQGDTAFARLAHLLAVSIGEFVVRRKDLVRDAIGEIVRGKSSEGEALIASIGCGPAREVAEFVTERLHEGTSVVFTLVDHDESALRFAGQSIRRALETRGGTFRTRTDLRKVSALRLLRDIHPAELLGQVDMIYSAGLFDYFSDRTCRLLARRLYEALHPGGTLLLGNMKAGTDMLWPLHFIADWNLTYRTAESIMRWAEDLPGAEISLRTEATGYDYMLFVRKPR